MWRNNVAVFLLDMQKGNCLQTGSQQGNNKRMLCLDLVVLPALGSKNDYANDIDTLQKC